MLVYFRLEKARLRVYLVIPLTYMADVSFSSEVYFRRL